MYSKGDTLATFKSSQYLYMFSGSSRLILEKKRKENSRLFHIMKDAQSVQWNLENIRIY